MSIGSLTCWNFGAKVRSIDSHYLLHWLSVSEKDSAMEALLKQHTDKLAILDGNIINICSHWCTVEFQPSAGNSGQSWANKELNQAASYLTYYANVSKDARSGMGQSIGFSETDIWKSPTQDKRIREAIQKLNKFRRGIPKQLNLSQIHSRKLAFMASNGIRHIGRGGSRQFCDGFRVPKARDC